MDLATVTQEHVNQWVADGLVFIYPTDTVYGLGCDAAHAEAVQRIRVLKGSTQPFSVIAPSLEWIYQHCTVNHPSFLEQFPGPITLILQKKEQSFLHECAPGSTLGVRIPDHSLTPLFQATGKPIVTTSANRHGEPTPAIPTLSADITIEGAVSTTPSALWDLTGREPKQLR